MEHPASPEIRETALHASSSPLELVCVHAQEDEQYFRRLQRHFHPWVRQQKIVWLEISAGEDIGTTMQHHLKRATAILLLLSPDFLAEETVYQAMLTALAENERRKVLVVPVLARPSAWKDCECGAFQALPEHDQPVTAWADYDEAYENIRQGFLRLLPALQANVKDTIQATSHATDVASLTTDFRARDLPGEYVPRSSLLARMKSFLLNASTSQTTAITTVLRGAGGFGKTTLALALCHDPEIQAAFPDGVLWIELGEQPPHPLDLLNRLLARLVEQRHTALTLEEALGQWRAALEKRTCLLVIDDVWQPDILAPLLGGGPRCCCLITTRNDQVLPPTASRVIVDEMEPAEALALLCQGLPVEIYLPDAQTAFLALVKKLGYWPYLLALARGLLATHLRYGRPLKEALAVVEQVYQTGSGISWQQGQASGFHEVVEASFQASFRQLQRVIPAPYKPLERFQELAIFPEDTDIPISLLRLFWQVMAGLQSWEVDHLCMQLHSLSLLLSCDLATDTIRLHDVTRTYLMRQAGNQLSQFHAHFLDAVRQRLHLTDWAEMPLDENYLWQHLLSHLCQAGRWTEVATTLTDLRFLVAKAHTRGVAELEGDLERVAVAASKPFVPDQPVGGTSHLEIAFLPTMRRQVSLVSHYLRQSTTLEDMGRVALLHLGWKQPFVGQQHLLEQSLPYPYLIAWYPLPDRSSSALLRTFSGHTGWVNDCVINKDGNLVVSASYDRTLKVWDVSTGAELRTLSGHTAWVSSCAVSEDGRLIVSSSWDHTLKIWDVASGAELYTLSGHTKPIVRCAMSRDGRLIVSASADRTLKVWDAVNGVELLTLSGHVGEVNGCAISGDGRLVVSASGDQTLKVWDIVTGAVLRTFTGHTGLILGCTMSEDDRLIVSTSYDGILKVWDAATGEERLTLSGHAGAVNSCAVSRDGHLIVSVSQDHTLKVWDATVRVQHRAFSGYIHAVNSCFVSRDGRLIVSASADRTLKVWDATTGTELHTLTGHTGAVRGCAISGDGRVVVSTSEDRTLKTWDAVGGAELRTFSGHAAYVYHGTMSEDGRLIISASEDGTLKVWDATTGAERRTLLGHTNAVRGCLVSKDGRLVVSASDDYTLKVWDEATGKEIHTLSGHTSLVSSCAMSENGHLIVSTSHDRTLKIWDVATGQCMLTYSFDGELYDCAFHPDGERLVVCGEVGLYFLRLVIERIRESGPGSD